jgi:predicted ATPase
MRLTSLTVQHYKSLSNVGMDNIQPVTVLVGTNAAGKSNVVDVLKFLRDMVSESLEHAISRRNGITAIRQHSRTRPYQISIKLCLLDDEFEDGEARESSYEITISSLVAGNYKVEREAAFWYEDEHDFDEETQDINFIGVAQHSMQRSSDGIVLRNGKETKLVLPPDQVALGLTLFRHSDGIAAKISNFVRSLRFTTIFPNTLREPKKPDADAALKETGENWASILKALKRTPKGRHELERIKEMMQVVMPNLRDVSVTTVGGYLVPQFRVAETSGKKEVTYDLDPSQLSDGTLRVLGILLALYQLPHPSFVAIEEPEQTVHPGLLEAIKEKLISIQELMLAEGLQVEEA